MARYKHTDVEDGQGVFLSVNLHEQLIEGTFEHMLNELIGTKIDVSCFDENYSNDKTGAPATPPEALLKLIFYGYSKKAVSSRRLQELNENNIIAKALTNNIDMHWTTIADFISGNSEKFKEIFIQVLAYCNELGLIGNETFAIDGCRLPSNASLEMTGTKEELEKRLKVYKRMAEKHIERHRRRDERGEADEEVTERYETRQKKLRRQIEKISVFLNETEKKEGKQGQEIRSNVTDNESALIKSSGGYIQGYIGIAAADEKSQILVSAQAVGSANEGEHFSKMLEETKENLKKAGVDAERPESGSNGGEHEKEGGRQRILADNNYWSEYNFRAAASGGMEMVTPDKRYKTRLGDKKERRYEHEDFVYEKEGNRYRCPCGKWLKYKKRMKHRVGEMEIYKADVNDCRECDHFKRCVNTKKEQHTICEGKHLAIRADSVEGSFCTRMKEKLNTDEYQDIRRV